MTVSSLLRGLACATLALHGASHAILPHEPSVDEVKLLPAGCQAKLKGINPKGVDWKRAFGEEVWLHTHHYCYGLNFVNRSRFTLNRKEKKYYLERAVDEFGYVLTHWPKSTPLIAEAQARKTEAQTMLKMLSLQ